VQLLAEPSFDILSKSECDPCHKLGAQTALSRHKLGSQEPFRESRASPSTPAPRATPACPSTIGSPTCQSLSCLWFHGVHTVHTRTPTHAVHSRAAPAL